EPPKAPASSSGCAVTHNKRCTKNLHIWQRSCPIQVYSFAIPGATSHVVKSKCFSRHIFCIVVRLNASHRACRGFGTPHTNSGTPVPFGGAARAGRAVVATEQALADSGRIGAE